MGVRMPATLLEIGFLSNPRDERSLRSSARRDLIADAVTKAVLAFGEDYNRRRGIDLSAARPNTTNGDRKQ